MLNTIFLAVLIGAISTVVAFIIEIRLDQVRKKRAYDRIVNEPLLEEGVELRGIKQAGCDGWLVGPCIITSISVGRVEVETQNAVTKERISFTGRELESLHPFTIV